MAEQYFPFADAPRQEEYNPCIRCGLCLESCPTFQQTGRELESPRGRVQLIAAVAEGVVPLASPRLAETLFTCLDCRACEVACPSGVPIGSLIEKGRAQVVAAEQSKPRPRRGRSVNRATHWAVRHVMPYPRRLRTLASLLGGMQRLRLLGTFSRPLPIGMRRLASALPEPGLRRVPAPQLAASGRGGLRTGVFLGCVMEVIFSDANAATVRVLTKNGAEVKVPQAQTCCGALAVHAGDRDQARALARQNIDAFLQAEVDVIATNAGGCGAALMEYAEWLAEDVNYRDRAREFSAQVRDVSVLLKEMNFRPPRSTPRPQVVTYQASCHLHNVMKAGSAPVDILKQIPGLEVREMADAARCCGSAGIYNLSHPIMAEALLRTKMADVPDGTETIATGNPGCWLQMLHGVKTYRPGVSVRHVVQILDEAYASEESEAGDVLADAEKAR